MRLYRSRRACLATISVMTAFLLFTGHGAQGQAFDSDEWQLSVTPYFWFSGIDGDVRVRDAELDVDVGFDDVWDALDLGVQVHIEAQKGRWGLLLDPTFLAMAVEDEELDAVDAELDIDLWIVEFGGFYRVIDARGGRGLPMSLDVLIGGRYWNMQTELDIGPLNRESETDWVDPFVGLRWIVHLTDRILVLIRGDVGGFAVYEDASELTWNVFAGPAIELSRNLTLAAGYRALGVDKEEGDHFEADLTLAGPEVGLVIRF